MFQCIRHLEHPVRMPPRADGALKHGKVLIAQVVEALALKASQWHLENA